MLGKVTEAAEDAEQASIYADRSRDLPTIIGISTSCADVLHQAGESPTAKTLFEESEQVQAQYQPEYPLHYSVQGFQYCDLLLGATERVAWKHTLDPGFASDLSWHTNALDGVFRRTLQTLRWVED